jgi:hypothetical protein
MIFGKSKDYLEYMVQINLVNYFLTLIFCKKQLINYIIYPNEYLMFLRLY